MRQVSKAEKQLQQTHDERPQGRVQLYRVSENVLLSADAPDSL